MISTLLVGVACTLAFCGKPTGTPTAHSAAATSSSPSSLSLRVQTPHSNKRHSRKPTSAVVVVALRHLGSISYRCRSGARQVAATFTAAPRSATDQVVVTDGDGPIAHSVVQPSDAKVPLPHALSTPFGKYRSLDWVITQTTEPQVIVARVRLEFDLTPAHLDQTRPPSCEMPHSSSTTTTKSSAP